MIATDGYPQSNINPEGHTPMNTPTITKAATRYLSVELLDLGEQCIGLMPGDTVHIEATLRVRAVQHGLDYKDNPTETVSVKADPAEGAPDVVVRTSTWRALTEDGEQYDIDLTPAAEKTEPTRPSWLKRHKLDLKVLGGILGFMAWVASIALLVVILAGCSTGSSANTPSPSPAPAPVAACDGCAPNHAIPAVGEECTKVGTYNVSIKGKRLYCAEATAKRAARGDTAPRWITA